MKIATFNLIGLFLLFFLTLPLCSSAQELEEEPYVPHYQQTESSNTPVQRDENGKFVLKGSIQTLEAAINAEKDSVDWYAWYLGARDYITRHGGIACPAGTMITFHRNGKVDAQTLDPRCLLSLEGLHWPLPVKTKLEAVILPARSGSLPPATPSEIYQRTNGFR